MVKVLETSNLCYQDFKNIKLSLESSKLYLIAGANNSGKTTLFKLLSGIILTNNYISCNGVILNKDTSFNYIKNLGVVPKLSKKSFIYQNVFDEMMYPLYNLNYSKRKATIRIKEILKLFNKENIINKKINDLNYCDKQLLLLMISLLHCPKLVLIEDILTIFSKKEQKMIINILLKLIKQDNITIVIFASNLEMAKYCDKLLLLKDKEIVGEYSYNDLYKNDKLFYDNKLEIPFIVDLSIKLKMYELVDKNYTTIKGMVDDLWQ